MLAVAALGIIGCADKLADESGGTNGPKGDQGNVYMNVAVAFPTTTSTRSGTDEEGGSGTGNDQTNSDEDKGNSGKTDYEYGWAYENDVKTLLLVLTNKENKYITHAEMPITQSPVDQSDGNNGIKENFAMKATQKFSRQDISEAYGTGGLLENDKTVRVYAFCNYTADLLHKFDNITESEKNGEWLGWSGELTEEASGKTVGSIWTPNSFLMSNARIVDVTFPPTESGWDAYTTEDKPFHLSGNANGNTDDEKKFGNPVYVERTAARIDFKDGSEGDNTYPITTKGNEDDDINLVSVKLARMSLVNMSKNFYYLRRVSKDGTKTDSIVGGIEGTVSRDDANPSKSIRPYVVDTDADDKKKVGGINTWNAQDHFNFSLFVKPEHSDDVADEDKKDQYNMDNWYATDIEKVLEGKEDTWSGSKSDRYRIWRYVTENTIPSKDPDGTDYTQQKAIQSTGVVFKAKILPGKHMSEQVGDDYYVSKKVQDALNASEKGLMNFPSTSQGFDKTMHYDYPDLYLYNGTLYAGLEELVEVAKKQGSGHPLHAALDSVFQYWYYDKEGTEQVFKYRKPATADGEAATANEDETEVQLTVEIFNQILNSDKLTDEDDKTYKDYKVDFLNGDDDALTAFKKMITIGKGMTIYKASIDGVAGKEGGYGWGYYCYYFYWNRHNDNGKNTIMGPMEFATVRNNVYKLSVTAINQLGHPSTTPDDDPDPVDPEDPDEESKIYLDVKVEVLPWVVRVNDIIF